MVIQCPVCSTKFSVDSTEIAERRDPQFHCSRCDCLFDLKGKNKSSGVHPHKNKSLTEHRPLASNPNTDGLLDKIIIHRDEVGIQGSIFEDESPELHSLENSIDPAKENDLFEETQLTFFEETSDSSPNLKSRNSFLRFDDDDAVYREELPLIAAEWPDSRADRDLEIDLGEVARRSTPYATIAKKIEGEAIALPNKRNLIESELITSVAPRLSIPQKQNWKNIPEENLPESHFIAPVKVEDSSRTDDIQRIFDELERSERPAEVENTRLKERYQDTIPSFLAKDQGAVLTFPNRDKIKAESVETPKKKFTIKKIELPAALIGAMKINPGFISTASIRSLSLFLIGPAISTLALYAASVSSVTNIIPGTQSGLKAPPSGLELQALKSEVKLLADGTQFLEVTGNILNNTPVTYSHVELVARSFDHQNQKSSEILVDVNNGLQHLDNAQALKSDMLLRLQNETGVAHPIKPNEKIEVRLALPIDSEIPAYFDAEIFGVKKI